MLTGKIDGKNKGIKMEQQSPKLVLKSKTMNKTNLGKSVISSSVFNCSVPNGDVLSLQRSPTNSDTTMLLLAGSIHSIAMLHLF